MVTGFLAGLLLGMGLGAIFGNKLSHAALVEYEDLSGKVKKFEDYLKSLEGRTLLSVKELAQDIEKIFGKK